ncbi:MAG TPA: carboxymuconolactone decarboxylase family protein [Dissulfuribacter thermophilus]|uniref:Carboxymuconolactone decarboxylase family protein n=1 Tax=Dissulfuribacter thermophilus TaxID=1156395 RepID=A0A7V2SW79_9BACT|nr:carboxymuconolactone decarboxylase family protein [Dissulfuribacter thermophilus]
MVVELITDDKATGKVKEVFDEIREELGMVPNFFRALAGADPDWLEINWKRWKLIMGRNRALDRKTKELIAVAVSIVNQCRYCSLAHESMALMEGASRQELIELKEVVELFSSFNKIADSLEVPCDVTPEMVSSA